MYYKIEETYKIVSVLEKDESYMKEIETLLRKALES
jgi:hypothetical protein